MKRCTFANSHGQCNQDAEPSSDPPLCYWHCKSPLVRRWVDGNDPWIDTALADYLDDRERRLAELPQDAADYPAKKRAARR